jgi:hypothetical protein
MALSMRISMWPVHGAAKINMRMCMMARTGKIAPIERVHQRDCLAVATQQDSGKIKLPGSCFDERNED